MSGCLPPPPPRAPAFAEAALRYLLLRAARRLPRKQLPVVGKPPYRKVATRKSLGGEYADQHKSMLIFNIRHNYYRLIVKVDYRAKLLMVKEFLTHKEHTRGGWKKWAR